MYELRDYQQNGSDLGLDLFLKGSKKDRSIIVAPTGAGKSIYIAYIANMLKSGVLVLQPSKELLEQNYAKFLTYGGEASLFSASVRIKEVGEVTFATIGSIVNLPHLFNHIRYVIIDECHMVPPNGKEYDEYGILIANGSMYMQFLKNFPDVKVLGLTATPFRSKKGIDWATGESISKINLLTRESPKFFNKFLHVTQISELYEKGYLAPIKYLPIKWNNNKLKLNSTGAEFSDNSVDEALEEQLVYERLPDVVQQSINKGRKYRIVFVKSVAKAQALADTIPDSACVHAKTRPKDRERILNDFKAGKIKTVFNVGVLTIGFDFPALDCIILARPTLSLALYMQIIGRGLRTCEGKIDCAFVDMCGSYDRFGKIENIKYHLDYQGKWIISNGKKILSGVRLDK